MTKILLLKYTFDMYRIEVEVLGQKVHKALRTMIMNGELQPGQKLVQDDLAEYLGVSRTPILTAFSKLEQENLVVTYPRRGAYVKKYTNKELLDICKIRICLESLSVREAALKAVPEDIVILEEIMRDFDEGVKKNDNSLLRQADYNFHTEILRCSGNQFLYDMLFSYIIIVINMSGLMRYVELSQIEHHEILEAIKQRDPEQAELLMIKHTKRPIQFLDL
ncbi:MAG: GntR family transcriptional regulator [Treponema sp.]|nr:GntR family transcriptional regulator [Treponema sp.]